MKLTKLLLLFIGLLLGGRVNAQVNILTPDTAICAGSFATLLAGIGTSGSNFETFTDDVYSDTINIGFPFTFYGNTYTQCLISSNGFITFNLTNVLGSSPWNIPTAGGVPGNVNCLNSIMGAYCDVLPTQGGTIEYSTQGVAPYRRFVVTFCQVPMFSCTNLLYTMQLAIFETTNEIELYLGNKPSCPAWNSDAAIQGVQNAAGTQAVVVSNRNWPNTWTAVNDGQKLTPSGATYTVSSIPYNPLPVGINSIVWYELGNPTPIGSGTNISVSPTVTTTYIAQAGGNGCGGITSDTVTVSIAPPPPPPIVNSPVTYCQNEPAVTLTAIGTGLIWYTTPVGGTPLPSAPVPSTAALGSTTYYVSQSPNGCEGSRVPITVIVDQSIQATIAVSDNAICVSDATTVKAAGTLPPNSTYEWDYGGGIGSSLISQGPNSVYYTSSGTKNIKLTVKSGYCIQAVQTTVDVIDRPYAGIVATPAICFGDSAIVKLANNTPPNQTYVWDFGGGSAIFDSSNQRYEVKWPDAGGKFTSVTPTNDQCTGLQAIAATEVHPLPDAGFSFISDISNLCSGDTISFVPVNEDFSTHYVVNPFALVVKDDFQDYQARISKSEYLYINAISKYGCKASDSAYVLAKPCCEIHINNAFSPNGDGLNDFFYVKGLKNQRLLKFLISNRWGQVMFETTDITKGWDGTFNGVDMPIGTYFYYVQYSCGDVRLSEATGDITLVR